MPVCPGCERIVSHDRLPVHQRCCAALHGGSEDRTSAPYRVEQYLLELDERLTSELADHEAEVDRRLNLLEEEPRIK